MPYLDPFLDEAMPHLGELRAVARRLAGRADLADDLIQETFLRALAARHRYRAGSNARAWLYCILHNAACSAHRRERRDERLCERVRREPAAPRSQSPAPAAMGRSVAAALDALPAPLRATVVLVDVEELGYRDAAERLGVPVGTIMSRLHRARGRLRLALAQRPAPKAPQPRQRRAARTASAAAAP